MLNYPCEQIMNRRRNWLYQWRILKLFTPNFIGQFIRTGTDVRHQPAVHVDREVSHLVGSKMDSVERLAVMSKAIASTYGCPVRNWTGRDA